MSQSTTGIIYQTASGKYIRVYRTQSHVGFREFVQETPDINCATVVRNAVQQREIFKQATEEFGPLVELGVEVIREVKIVRTGDQPNLI